MDDGKAHPRPTPRPAPRQALRPAQTLRPLPCSAVGPLPLLISQRLDFRHFAYNEGARGFRFGPGKLRRCAHRKAGGSLFKGIDSRNLPLSCPKNGEDAGHPMPMGTSIYRGSLLVLNAVTRNVSLLSRSSGDMTATNFPSSSLFSFFARSLNAALELPSPIFSPLGGSPR